MYKRHSQIAIVIGTKAELIKCMPIMLQLQKERKDYWFIHTGQHPLGQACRDFGIKLPDFVLSREPERSTKFWSKVSKNAVFWSLLIIFKIKKKIKELKPKYVIYHGDTMSSSAAAIASSRIMNFNKNWKNVHLEAGLRSGSLFEPFPEEISRQICDRFSDILLSVSELSENNLRGENKRGEVIRVGNTIIESSLIAYKKVSKNRRKKEVYTLINIHRHENIANKERLEKIIKILEIVKFKAIWPLHANTARFIEKFGMVNRVKNMKNIRLTSLKSYPEFIFLLANCSYLITDGGSIQEESLVFKKPCVILRKRTERQEGLSTGINFLTGLDFNKAKKIIENIESGKVKVKRFKNPYGRKGLSKDIVKILN